MASGDITELEVCLQLFSNGSIGLEAADEVGYTGGWLTWATKGLLAAVGGHLTVVGHKKLTLGAMGCQVDASSLLTLLHQACHQQL